MKGGRRSPSDRCHEADFPSAAGANPASVGERGGGTDSFVADIPAVVVPRRRAAGREVTA